MNICIFTAQIGYYHDARYKELVSRGAKFTVIATQNEADFSEFMASENVAYPVRRLFDGRAAYLEACVSGIVWQSVHATLDDIDPTVVVVAGWATPESFAAITWARTHRRRIVMLSDSQHIDTKRSLSREWIKSRIVGLCDAALVAGPTHQDYIVQLGLPRNMAIMGYDVVDNEHFRVGAATARVNEIKVRAALGLPDCYLIASARFIPKKNLCRLIAAYSKARRQKAEAPDLVIIGDGPERGAMEAAIAREDLASSVRLPGFYAYYDLPALYGLSHGLAHVSTSEQWGLVINEAAASGVPIVASSACGATGPLVEDDVTGFVVDAESEASIRNGLMQLMDLDAPLRAQMGLAGQTRVADWGLERFAEGLLAACEAAEASRPRGFSASDKALLRLLSRWSIRGAP